MVCMFDFLQILSIYPSAQLLHTVSKCLKEVHLPHLLLWPGHQAASLAAARATEAYPARGTALFILFLLLIP